MAFAHSPKIVTDGLAMYVDAANPKSYPGGSTWYDLTTNGHNISLGSTVALASYADTSVLHFPIDLNGNGTNSSLNLSTSNYTVMSWVRKLDNLTSNGRTITANSNNWLLAHHDTTYGDYYAEGWVNNITSPSADTVWRMYTGTGHISNDQYSMFINTENQVRNSNGGSQGPIGWNLNGYSTQKSNCEIANLICYNRVLTDAEVQQNYNALKGRFGL